MPVVVGIETSCDETGVGVVRDGELIGEALASSMDEHARFGGVVPEVAARAHLEAMVPAMDLALSRAGITPDDVDAIAVTAGPGLATALQVGLDGSVNSETLDGVTVGAIGGQVDFVRGANASSGGRAIIALPATSNGRSRIVPHVETVTTTRGDVDAVVTEWGVAELAGCSLRERARRVIAIAAPEHREALDRSAFMQERQS